MARKLIAAALAASLALTGFTAPARADNNDALVKFLAGATALVIIGKALENNDNGRTVTRYTHGTRRDWREGRRDRGRHYRDNPRSHRDDGRRGGHHTRRDNDRYLPSACRTSVRTRGGHLEGYDYRCVQNHPQLARRAPGQCVTQVRGRNNTRFIYRSDCLARHGYNG